MSVSKPLAAGLFVYDCVRLLLLAAMLFAVPPSGVFPGDSGAFFPYIVYLSSNALFPLMSLFVRLRPQEYRNYLPLYMAGKIIAVVSFYAWMLLVPREIFGMGNVVLNIALLGTSIFINLADILSVWGAWTLKSKYRNAEVYDADYPGGEREGGGR